MSMLHAAFVQRTLTRCLKPAPSRFRQILPRQCGFVLFVLSLLLSGGAQSGAAPAATTTTLAITSSGSTVSAVASGTVVTLTATVAAGTAPVTIGQVNFCDASATYCADIHLLGTTQLTSAGTAEVKFRPGIGNHSYKAVFLGTIGYLASSSSQSALVVTGKSMTTATIAQSGSAGNYKLTSVVSGSGAVGFISTTEQVSFLDTTYGNKVLASTTLGASQLALGWLNYQTPATGYSPDSIAVGDFNGDGIPDLAVANNPNYPQPESVTILLGDGNGGFNAAPTLAVGYILNSVAVGDFNGDGKQDLAVADAGTSTVLIFLGNGDGTFTQKPVSPSTGDAPRSMVVGDFNGDGNADLAVVNESGNTVTILLGNGDGTFTAAPVSPSTGVTPYSIAVGDFNGDGFQDLAVTNYGACPAGVCSGGTVTVLLGNGDGTFTAAASPSVGKSPAAIAVGDFNRDGNADLAVANNYGSNTVTILLGNGKGGFTAAPTLTTGIYPISVAIQDFNGDGIPDLAIATDGIVSGEPGTAAIWLGKGDGTFAEQASPSTGLEPTAIVAADFNGDGIPDLAAANLTNGTVSILLTEVTQTATATASGIAVKGVGPHFVEAEYTGDPSYASSTSGTTALFAPTPTPAITPVTGTYGTPQVVKITDATPGATIYFTIDGTTPSASSTRYTAPIDVSQSESVKAIAVATGYADSALAAATYTFHIPAAATPVFSLPSGVYPSKQTVTIKDAEAGATIYYTTNGATPTINSAKYSGAIKVSSSETLSAIAVATGHLTSVTASAQYIIRSSSTPFIYTFAGSGTEGYNGDGVLATTADLNDPGKTALDKAGNLYIADAGNSRIRKVAAGSRIIKTVAGNGKQGQLGDGGAATAAELKYPNSIAFDAAGKLYIADSANNTIRKVNLATGVITEFAGNGTRGYGGDGNSAASAELSNPEGLAFDNAGNLYIADSGNNRIRKVAAKTGIIITVVGNGVFGYSGDNGPAASAELRNPVDVAIDGADDLYIADSWNNVIRKVSASTGTIATMAGNGNRGYGGDGGAATSAELSFPASVALDEAGNFYIADAGNNAIRKVNLTTGVITTVAGNGNLLSSGDGGPATSAGISNPEGVSVDSAGNLYVSDLNDSRIREVTASSVPPASQSVSPVFTAPAGTYGKPQTVNIASATPGASIYLTMDGSVPTSASHGFNGPINVNGPVKIKAIAIAPGSLQSTEVTATYSITSPPPAVITTVAGNGISGYKGVGGKASSAELGYPDGVAVDSAGNLYIADSGNSVVWKVAAKTGIMISVAGTGTPGYSGDGGPAIEAELRYPNSVAIDGMGNLFIADSGNLVIRKVAAGSGVITTYAGNGQYGRSGDGGPATAAEFSSIPSVAIDSAGNLYVDDYSNEIIREVSASTGIITTVAGINSVDQCGCDSGDGGPATSAYLYYPWAIGVDDAGNLYIADNGFRIRKVNAKTGIIRTFAGDGAMGSGGDGGPATSSELVAFGIAFDKAGNLYLSTTEPAIRRVSASTGVITTVAGNGIYGYSGDGGSATLAELDGPQGIACDAAGDLYIADTYNYRVRKVAFNTAEPQEVSGKPNAESVSTEDQRQ